MVERILQEIERHGFALVDGLVSDLDLKKINHFFQEQRSNFRPAKIGQSTQRVRQEAVRGDYTYWLDPLNVVGPFGPIVSFLERLKASMNSSFYLGLQQFECHLAYYPPGTFYKTHSDRFESSSSRKLSFVFYLNEEWSEDWGGELILYNKDLEVVRVIGPRPGTFVCFLSEDFPHEVRGSLKERRSLTGWMHTKIIY